MDICMYVCMDIWIYGYMYVWIYGYIRYISDVFQMDLRWILQNIFQPTQIERKSSEECWRNRPPPTPQLLLPPVDPTTN